MVGERQLVRAAVVLCVVLVLRLTMRNWNTLCSKQSLHNTFATVSQTTTRIQTHELNESHASTYARGISVFVCFPTNRCDPRIGPEPHWSHLTFCEGVFACRSRESTRTLISPEQHSKPRTMLVWYLSF